MAQTRHQIYRVRVIIPVAIAVAGFIFGLGQAYQRIGSLESRLQQVEPRQLENTNKIAKLEERMQAMNTLQGIIRDDLNDLENAVHGD